MLSREQIQQQSRVCLLYLKQAIGALHSAKLAMEPIDPKTAPALERVVQEIRGYVDLCHELAGGKRSSENS